MAEWDWVPDAWRQPPPAPASEPYKVAPPAPPGEDAWPTWLGGTGGATEPVEPETPAAPADDELAPLDPFARPEGVATGLGADVSFPPAHWFSRESVAPELGAPAAATAQPDPVLDALSGGTPEPVADPNAPVLQVQPQDVDPVGVEQARIESLSPEEYAAEGARAAAARDAYLVEKKAEALRQNREEIEANAQRLAEHRAKAQAEYEDIAAEAKRLSETKIDPKRWFANASTGQQVGAFVASAIGGFLQGYNGGRNTGLEHVMGLIDRDIEAQRQDLQTQQAGLKTRTGLVGELYAQGMDEYQAAEAVRLATLSQIDEQLGVEAAKYDPQGTTARRIVEARLQVRQKQAEAAAKAQEQLFERSLKVDASERDWARIQEQKRAARAGERRADRAFEWEQKKYGLDQDAAAAEQQRELDKEQRQRTIGGEGELVQRDDTPFAARTKEEAVALRKKKAAVDRAAELIDEIVELRREHGWESSTLKGAPLQKMRSNIADLQIAFKNMAELGVLAGPDMELINSALGTGDPTEIRDPTPGLLNARDNFLRNFDADLRGQGYDGEPYSAKRADAVKSAKESYQPETVPDFEFVAEYGRVPQSADDDSPPIRKGPAERAAAFIAGAKMMRETRSSEESLAWAERMRKRLPPEVLQWVNAGPEARAKQVAEEIKLRQKGVADGR